MSIRQILFLILLFQYSALAMAAAQQTNKPDVAYFAGPFQSIQRTSQMSATHFYIYNNSGNAFTLNLQCKNIDTRNENLVFHRLMVRVFDANEQLVFRNNITSPQLSKQENLPDQVSIKVPQSSPGIIQVVVTGGRTPPATFDFTTDPPLPFGIMNSIKVITPPEQPINEGYIYIPPGARLLYLEPIDTEITLWDENGKIILQDKTASIPIKKNQVTWKIALKPKRFPGAKVFTDGFDVIICPDPNTARAIQGSVEYLDDGTIVAHKFQVRLDRLLRKTFSSPDSFTLYPIKSFEPLKDIFLSNPQRYQHLITDNRAVLPYLDLWFDRQVLDTKSPFFGGIHAPSSCNKILTPYQIPSSKFLPAKGTTEMNLPPVTDQQNHDLIASLSSPGILNINDSMAFLYNLDPNINPYYHNTRLLNRIIVAACRDLMLLDESELIYGQPGTDWMGTFAFTLRYKYCDAYGYVGQRVKELYPEIYKEWTNGITRFADRTAYMSVFAPFNQAAHIPYGLWQIYKGSKELFYKNMTQYTAEKLCQRLQKPAGYYVEGYGPCASYAGITLDFFAMLYIDSNIPLFKESIQKAYYCFNHTVVPEPDGTLIGSTDFNHRVQRPWTVSQYLSGREMMAPYLPEVAVWARQASLKQTEQLKKSMEQRLKKIPYSAEYLAKQANFDFNSVSGENRRFFEYYNPNIAPGGMFPYEEKASFIRNLGDEFIAVKQPGYYALIYVGKPGIPPQNKYLQPMQKGPRTGGGLSLFWTPDYYVVLAAQGWNSFCHHGIIAETKLGRVNYADYYSVNFSLDNQNKTLTVEGQINDTPLKYTHHYYFDVNSIKIKTVIQSEQDFDAKSCYMQLPVFISKQRGFLPDMPSDKILTIRLADKNAASVYLHFNEPVKAELAQITEEKIDEVNYKIQQLKIQLPSKWKKSQTFELIYSLTSDLKF